MESKHRSPRTGFPACLLALTVVAPVATQEQQDPAEARSPKLERIWRYAPAKSRFAALAVHDGIVVTIDRATGIHALASETGKRLWQHEQEQKYGRSYDITVTRDEGFDVALIAGDEGLLALDRKTGKEKWKRSFDTGANGTAYNQDFAFTATADGKLHGVDLRTGKLRWSYDFVEDKPDDPDGWDGERARFGGLAARPSGVRADTRLAFLTVFDQSRAIAVDASTGKLRWSFQAGGWIYAKPTIGRRDVYISSQDRFFYGLAKNSGKVSWKHRAKGRNEAPAAVTSRLVLCPSCDGRLYAVDRALGSLVWTFETDKVKGRRASIYCEPIILGQRVYLATLSGQLYMLDLQNGKRIAKVEVGSEIQDFALEAGVVFIATRKSNTKSGESAIYAYRVR